MTKPIIYIFVNRIYSNGDVIGCAIAEDGTPLAGHLSSNEDFLKHGMGLTSSWKHDKYKVHYPDGYELKWLNNLDTELPKEVLERNQALAKQEER